MVDAIGLETDFTLELNRKRVKEKILKSTKTPELYFLDLKFQTIMKKKNEDKTYILHIPHICHIYHI